LSRTKPQKDESRHADREELLRDKGPVLPIRDVPDGRRATVVSLEGGHEFQNHLMSMGLLVGSEIEVINSCNGRRGPTLVAVGETRLALGYGMSGKILVEVISRH
jgi:ferrous iron transport protein A